MNENDITNSPRNGEGQKKVYVSPELTVHGDIRELTTAVGPFGNEDGAFGSFTHH